MQFRKGVFFGSLALSIVGLLFVTTQTAFAQVSEVASVEYSYQNDPFLLQWSLMTQTEEEKPQIEEKALSAEEKILARWKAKQAAKWAKLPTGTFTVNASAYTAAADECGKSDGITASGLKVAENRTLACPPEFPFGTMIRIDGMGDYRCEDRGGAIKGNKVDIYMETKAEAFAFGRQNLTAQVIAQ